MTENLLKQNLRRIYIYSGSSPWCRVSSLKSVNRDPKRPWKKVILETWKYKKGLGRTPHPEVRWNKQHVVILWHQPKESTEIHGVPEATHSDLHQLLHPLKGLRSSCPLFWGWHSGDQGWWKKISFIQGQASWNYGDEVRTSEFHLRDSVAQSSFTGREKRSREQWLKNDAMATMECMHVPPWLRFYPEPLKAGSWSYFKGIFLFCKLSLSAIYVLWVSWCIEIRIKESERTF